LISTSKIHIITVQGFS